MSSAAKSLIIVSFSGGRTSGYLCKVMLDAYPRESLRFVFANTGQEHEKTLEFVNQVDKHFGLDLVWVEPVVHSLEGMATTHRIVNFESATRDVSLFKAMTHKYGLPGPGWPHCTRELKERPFHSYLDQLKLDSYHTALGIRADEPKRWKKTGPPYNIIQPLVDMNVTKHDVLRFWASMPFNLEIPEHLGNCKACWKKSNRKLALIADENPEILKELLPLDEMKDCGKGEGNRRMFRSRRNVADILAHNFPSEDTDGACEEVCEVFSETTTREEQLNFSLEDVPEEIIEAVRKQMNP